MKAMKILVESEKTKIKLFVPLWLMKSKLLIKWIGGKDKSGSFAKIAKNRELIRKIYTELKKHKGLVLVDVISKDAVVKIVI